MCIIFFFKEIIFILLYKNLNIATPLSQNNKSKILHRSPQWSNMPFWYVIYIQ